MARRPIDPRSIPLHLLVLTVAVGCVVLGAWQLDRARDLRELSAQPGRNAALEPVPLDSVVAAWQQLSVDDVGRHVTVSGSYDPTQQLIVPDRLLDGEPGALALAPLVLPDGTAVVVVRGWQAGSAAEPPDIPDAQVTVEGWLGPSDPEAVPGDFRAGTIGSVHLPTLVNLLPYDLRGVVLNLTAETPDRTDSLQSLPAPARQAQGRWPIQNVFYAIEWWVFGAAAVLFWVSLIRRGTAAPPRATGPAELVADRPGG